MARNQRQSITAVVRDRRGRILGRGQNSYTKTHPVQAYWARLTGAPEQRCYLHAEIAALISARGRGQPWSIDIARQGRSGKYLLAAPCGACLAAIQAAGIRRITHT